MFDVVTIKQMLPNLSYNTLWINVVQTKVLLLIKFYLLITIN